MNTKLKEYLQYRVQTKSLLDKYCKDIERIVLENSEEVKLLIKVIEEDKEFDSLSVGLIYDIKELLSKYENK